MEKYPQTLKTEMKHAGVLKDRPKLLEEVNGGLDQISQEERGDIFRRWSFAGGAGVSSPDRVELNEEEKAWLMRHTGPVVVGAETDWPPFDFVRDGKPTGFSNDLLQMAAKKIGLPLKFVHGLTWAELLAQIKVKKIDILPAVYQTPEREKEMAFTSAYSSNPSVLVTNIKSQGIRGIKDLAGKKLAVVEGFSVNQIFKEKYPDIEQVPFPSVLEGLKAVSLGKTDAFIGSMGVISYLLGENVIPYLQIVDEVHIEKPEATQLHMATLKDQAILRDILQKGLDSITQAEKQGLKLRWLPIASLQVESQARMKLPAKEKNWLSKHPKVRIGVMDAWPPMNFVDSAGKPAGIGFDYLRLLSSRLGDIFEVEPGPFKGNLAKAKEKKDRRPHGCHPQAGAGRVSELHPALPGHPPCDSGPQGRALF